MSPLALRRYRAERLLREEFDGLRERVIATVRRRLGAIGARVDERDLEACYAQAWHGLYTAVLEGQEIANPTGWLVLVTYRRAIEEHRARARIHRDARDSPRTAGRDAANAQDGGGAPAIEGAADPDMAGELDDRIRIRQLFEGLRGRLSARERQAAALCYLQGLSRSEAAARLGVSEARMRKLMEGHGPGRPGVAGKVGELAETIRGGGWCDEQGSLMRALAYGLLDPQGDRHRLARIHHSQCPACRAYVLSLRGLAAVLPPVPWLLSWVLSGGAGVGAGAAGTAAVRAGIGAGTHAGGGFGAGAGLGGATRAAPAVGNALSASGAAGASAGGGWLLAGGPAGAKLAVGCLLALSVGAGCVALSEHSHREPPAIHRAEAARNRRGGAYASELPALAGLTAGDRGLGSITAPPQLLARPTTSAVGAVGALTSARRASLEFGPERPASDGARSAAAEALTAPASSGRTAHAANAGQSGQASPSTGGSTREESGSSAASAAPAGRSTTVPAAQREFAPG